MFLRMFKNVCEHSMVWSYSPKLTLFCFSKETIHKSKCSLHQRSHKIQQGLAEDESLTLNYWDLKLMEKLRLLFHFPIRIYCFIQLGSTYCPSLLARPENALDNVMGTWVQMSTSHKYSNVPSIQSYDLVFYLCGENLLQESFKTSRKSSFSSSSFLNYKWISREQTIPNVRTLTRSIS